MAVPLVVAMAGAWSYRWVQEDAFINFRIIANLLAGHGPVFNIGERVEAYSDPLWVFVLAAIHEVLPVVSLEWLSLILGLALTGAGVVFGSRAVQRLAGAGGEPLVLPLGLTVFASVAGVWEFSTSGLEMGMAFCWIGLSFWLLVRTERISGQPLRSAFVIGLGPLIRPELTLMSVVLLVSLEAVVLSVGWRAGWSGFRRIVTPPVIALALPVAYELWRMSYFALVVPNTALAKSATGTDWRQGLTYLWNFMAPYTLWLPLALSVPLFVPRVRHWWTSGDRIGVILLLTPAVAGLADALYVVRLGGDYMHARLLLPAFYSLSVGLYFSARQLRTAASLSLAGILVWCVVCAGWLRTESGRTVASLATSHGIADERSLWVAATGNRHPVTIADYRFYALAGYRYRQIAASSRRQRLLVAPPVEENLSEDVIGPARSPLPFRLAVNMGNVGIDGVASGPQVYVFDTLSLANPIGSHTVVAVRGRPGHEKTIGPVWMIARFGIPTEARSHGDHSDAPSVHAAREALRCGTLRSYLHAVTAPMSVGLAASNVLHALAYSTFSFSSDPNVAVRQLCAHRQPTPT